jgi:hypothetical protein
MAHPLDELATALGHSYGGWFPIARYYATDDYGRWISLPLGGYGTAIVYRPSLIRAAGFDTIPDDFEGFLHLCQRLFSIGAPAAFGFGSDLNGTWTDWLLSGFGSSLFDENGLGNDRTHLALEFARELFPYFASSSQSGTAESIYRAFLAGEISLTGSTPAIFRLSEWGREDIDHAYYPIGPSGLPSQSAHVILASVMSTTHYPRAALEYLRFMVERPQYVDLQRTSFLTHPLRAYDDNPLWREIPQLAAYKGALRNALPYPKNIDEWKARGIVQNMSLAESHRGMRLIGLGTLPKQFVPRVLDLGGVRQGVFVVKEDVKRTAAEEGVRVSKEISQLVMFVTFFLPGIISSTVFFYVADVVFSEFFFCVASVIFGLLNILMLTIIISLLGLLQKGCQNAGLLRPRTVARFDDLAVHQLIAFAVAISIVISPIMAYAYDEGLLLRSLNLVMEKVNMPISKLHQDGPLHYILRAFRYDAEEQNDAIRRTLERRPRKHFSTSIGVYVRI